MNTIYSFISYKCIKNDVCFLISEKVKNVDCSDNILKKNVVRLPKILKLSFNYMCK